MSTWTFTTTDLREAAAISLLCVAQNLHGVTENKTDTSNKPTPSQTRRKAAHASQSGWSDPEARKLRTKVRGWADANVRKKGYPLSYDLARPDSAVYAYAGALGIPPEQAAEKINYHRACEAEFTRTGGWSARP